MLPSQVERRSDVVRFFAQLVQELFLLHKKIGGRTELRYGKSVLFIDLSLSKDFDAVFLLLERLGVDLYALHEGKYQVKPKKTTMNAVGVEYLLSLTKKKSTWKKENIKT